MFKFFYLGLLTVVLISCGATANYVGKSYPETIDVEVFMDRRDVVSKYETMGYVDATSGMFDGGFGSAQKKIEQLARKKGADAIIFEGFDRIIVTDPSIETKEEKKKDDNGGYTKTTTTTSTPGLAQGFVKATFIKYK